MSSLAWTRLWTFAGALFMLACSAGKDSSGGTQPGLDASFDGTTLDIGPGFDGDFNPDTVVDLPAKLHGKVFAPEGTIPISGALVYTTGTPPPEIPDHVYCDACVKLAAGTPFTETAPDGSFTLPTSLGEQLLVVQKGAFRRVRKINATAGDQAIDKALTTMPKKIDKAAGDDIPKIAVMLGAWDPIELVLARMGLEAKITTGGLLPKARVLSKDATAFAIYGTQDLGEVSPYPAPIKLITDPAEISKYHIVFIPCSGSSSSDPGGSGPQCSGVYAYGSATTTTLDGFVKAGGKLYVSDWSYEYVRQVFPGYVSWQGESSTVGSACQNGGGDQTAKVDDKGLADWLAAQGKSLTTVKDAWTFVTDVHAHADVDPTGKPITETPQVWVEANGKPATTSFEHSCGRVLFTTYHTQPTNETSGALEPQALALLYLILEVDVCVGPSVIK